VRDCYPTTDECNIVTNYGDVFTDVIDFITNLGNVLADKRDRGANEVPVVFADNHANGLPHNNNESNDVPN
jgi:hypothetical protein